EPPVQNPVSSASDQSHNALDQAIQFQAAKLRREFARNSEQQKILLGVPPTSQIEEGVSVLGGSASVLPDPPGSLSGTAGQRCGRARRPHPPVPRRPGLHRTAPPRRSGARSPLDDPGLAPIPRPGDRPGPPCTWPASRPGPRCTPAP